MSKKLSSTRKTITWSALVANLKNLVVKYSKGNSKMGKILSFNITAGGDNYVRSDGLELTDFRGSCDGCCDGCTNGCYARNSEIRFKTVMLNNACNYALAKENMAEFKRQVIQILHSVKNDDIPVRIHECGEFFSLEYMAMWLDIIEMFPNKRFYTYTKRYTWVKMLEERILSLSNFRMNISAFRGNLETIRAMFPKFSIFLWDDSNIIGENCGVEIPHDLRCPAVSKSGHMNKSAHCDKCGLCHKAQYAGKVIACYDHSKSEKHVSEV